MDPTRPSDEITHEIPSSDGKHDSGQSQCRSPPSRIRHAAAELCGAMLRMNGKHGRPAPASRRAHSPLQGAARALDVRAVQGLLSDGADPRAGNPTPLQNAMRAYPKSPPQADEIIRELVSYGAMERKFAHSDFPPRLAVLSHRTQGAFAAMLQGARLGNRQVSFRTAVDENALPKFICETGRVAALRALLGHGWDACTPDAHGATLLHYTVSAPHLDERDIQRTAELLLEHGKADLSLRDCFGRNVLQIARKRRLRTVCALLERNGAVDQPYSWLLLRRAQEHVGSYQQKNDK